MYKYFYNIAETVLSVRTYKPINDNDFEMFRCDEKNADIEIDFENQFPFMTQEIIYQEMGVIWAQAENGSFVLESSDVKGNPIARLIMDKNYKKAKIQHAQHTSTNPIDYIFGMFGEILFRNHMIAKGGIVLHAAAILHNKKAILFSGPSGSGKTTQAELWQKYIGAVIINGDRPPLSFYKNTLKVYGSAWSGSSRIFKDISATVGSIVFLAQDNKNIVTKLKDTEAVEYLLPRTFMSYSDVNLLNTCINNIEKIAQSTDTYLLRCTPDKMAVHVLLSAIEKQGDDGLF